jgi:hypothetical protein
MGIWLGVNNPVRMVKKCSKPHREITDQRERVGVGAGLAKPLVRIVDWDQGGGKRP